MSSKGDKPIRNYLLDFGLTDKEATCYLTLLKSGPNTIMNLSRETGIKRSTTHNTVEELVKKGLISQTNYGERRMIVAEDPEKLRFLMEQKKWDIKKLEENMPDIVKTIYSIVPKVRENTEVEVKYYKGIQEIKYVYEQVLKASVIHTFVNVDRIKENLPEYIEIFSKTLKSKDIEMWEILEHKTRKSDSDDEYDSPKYHFKYVPKDKTLNDTDITIFDDSIALIDMKRENPSAIVICSKTLASTLRNVHQMVWKFI